MIDTAKPQSTADLVREMQQSISHESCLCAFELLYKRYFDQVHRKAYTILEDHGRADGRAEDIALGVFMQVYMQRSTIRPETFEGWLFTTTTHECFNALRGKKRARDRSAEHLDRIVEQGKEPTAPELSPEDQAMMLEELHHLSQAIQRLPKNERQVIVYYYYEHMTCQEIADVMGSTVAKVRVLRARALKKLRDWLR
jgi:RNA polymerase sigma factor (sigma-70 family)